MIIYNTSWLKNLIIKDQIHHDLRMGDITNEELQNIQRAYPIGFYSPNIFVRTGLFILTAIIAGFSSGLLAIVFLGSQSTNPTFWCILSSVFCYAALEIVVSKHYHFSSGVDDALLWISGGFIISSFFYSTEHIFDQHNPITGMLFTSGFVALLALYFTLRFANPLMAVICFLAILIFLAIGWNHTGAFGAATLPFLIMILSAAGYFVSWRGMRSLKTLYYYRQCLELLQIASLLVLYLAGNYYVVQQLGAELYGYTPDTKYHVPMPYFFWAWTILLPFVYIGFGIKRKSSLLLRSGLFLIAAAALTFRNYYHVMPVEGTLVLLGILLLGVSYSIIRYLKTPKNGFTYQDLNENSLEDHLKIESLIVSAIPTSAPGAAESRFGGGNFGGGGSSGSF